MLRVEIAERARDDLTSIYDWGMARFGMDVADRTAREFLEDFGRLAEFPMIGMLAQGRRDGVRRLGCGSHIIFYRPDGDRVLVVRVLHKRMDVEAEAGGE